MRIIYSLCCLLVVACSERHQTFTGIDGTFNTTEFVVRAAGTDSLLFTAAPTFHFSPCNTTEAFDIDDPCMVRIDDSSGRTYPYLYRIGDDQGLRYLEFSALMFSTADSANQLIRSLTPNLALDITDKVLRLSTEDLFIGSGDSVEGTRDYKVSVTAVKE